MNVGSDPLGLDEYMYWCDDMGMEPFLILWNGKSYNEILTGPDLDPYIEDALNELEYLTGPPDSIYGKLRVQNGREEPWKLTYVGIGNEDDYTGGCETHPERFTQFYNVLREKYPDLVLIASTMKPECLPEELPKPLTLDQHYYRKPDELVAMFNYWDNQPRDQPVIVGEFGARNFTDPDGVFWTFMQMACSEAVHMIGIERNSDIIKMAAYAPLLQHYGFTQWSVSAPTSGVGGAAVYNANKAAYDVRFGLEPRLPHSFHVLLRAADVLNQPWLHHSPG